MKHINLYYGYINNHTIDANKHPNDQINDLVEYIRTYDGDTIDVYCNSPYVLFNITLMEAYSNAKVPNEFREKFKDINITNKHFEVTENGDVVEGKYYKNMISDENLLNDYLGKSNDDYSGFLELNDKLEKMKLDNK